MTTWILLIGVLAMAPVMILTNKFYGLRVAKVLASMLMLTALAYVACKLLFLLENGHLEGQSFFGAVLLAPAMTWLTAKALKIPVPVMMDLYSPAVCVMLAVQKIGCLYSGCCYGRVFAYAVNGDPIRFPSQIVECAAGLLLGLLLFFLASEEKYKGKLLPCFLVLYGVLRYVLNLLRDTRAVMLDLAYGNIWAIVSVALGAAMFALPLLKERNSR